MAEITPAQRRALRARAHHLEPVVMIGEAGLTEPVLREIEAALRSHELIKIRVLGEDRSVRDDIAAGVCAATSAAAVQQIGKILVIYREKPPEDVPVPKRKRARRRPRRTKRSFQ